MTITDEKLAELRRIAEAAWPEPWPSAAFDFRIQQHVAAHIAAFNPKDALALLDALAGARAALVKHERALRKVGFVDMANEARAALTGES